MKNLVGWVLGGLAAWYVYENWFASPAVSAPPSGGIIPASTPPAAPGAAPAPVPVPVAKSHLELPASVLSSAYAAAIMSNAPSPGQSTLMLNMDQWNYYVDHVSPGASQGAGLDAGAIYPDDPNRGGPLSWSQYQAIAQAHGLSGRVPRRRANYVRTRY